MSNVAWRISAAPGVSGVHRASPRARSDASLSLPVQRSRGNLDARFLAELARAYSDMRAHIAQALPATSSRAHDLASLRAALRGRLDQFLEALSSCCDEQDAVDALVPLVFFVDEQVERALAGSADPGDYCWPQLQRDLFAEGRAEGGDLFYERAEAHLAEQTKRPVVLASYLFCLKANFRGRLADSPEQAVESWLEALAAALPSPAARSELSVTSWRTPRPLTAYVWLTLLVVLVWHLILFVWAYFR